MILPKSDIIPNEVCAGLDTVAIRMPSHPIAHEIIKKCGFPLAAPSANTSGKPSPTAAAHVMNDMDGKIAAVVDGGSCSVGVESTVVTLACPVPRVLRPGGRLIYAVPGAEHLFQMKAVLYEKPYKNPVQEVAYPGFEAIGEREVSGSITVPAGQLEALFAMTPYYWKTPRDGAARLAALPELTTDISFRFLVFEKK